MSKTAGHRNNKRALLIGVDSYPKLSPRRQLDGCVNDAEAMAGILERKFGIPTHSIVLLRDEEATRDGILVAMDKLVDSAETDDVVIVHFSGHGSQITDREGDEPDGLDETIVPHDGERGVTPNSVPDITDDEIYVRLVRLTEKTSNVTLLFDCCHSGSITRDSFGTNARWVEPDMRPAEELPPSPISHEMQNELRTVHRDVGPSAWLPLGKRYVLIAGCRDEESSYEHVEESAAGSGGVTHGAFTYFLIRELENAQPGTTYRDVFESASALVTAKYPRQHPQMEGARDRELFGVRDIEPMRFVPVKRRIGGRVILGAGAAHGVTKKSRWALYPQATKRIVEDTPSLGTVEIDVVRAVTSDAAIVEEGDDWITQHARAVEVAHHFGQMRLMIDIFPPPVGYEDTSAELVAEVQRFSLLQQAKDPQTADARVYIVAPRAQARQDDPVPQLGPVSSAVWAVVGMDGQLLMPTRPADRPGMAAALCTNLEQLSKYRNALALRNPNEKSPLAGKVEFTLLRQTRAGIWKEAKPEDAGGQIVFEEGERIAFRITNKRTTSIFSRMFDKYDAPIFVSILDFGLTGAVNLLYPIEGASEQLISGNSLEVGVRQGEEIELYVPHNFPYGQGQDEQALVGGIETFKLFATTRETDFSWLTQPGIKSREISSNVTSPLEQLLTVALTGYGMRDARPKSVSSNEEWTTVERSFLLRPK